jgi:hypothetical protein
MKLEEVLDTKMGNEIEIPSEEPKKKFDKLVDAIKEDDSLKMTYIINQFPRIKIASVLDKLKRQKYKKYPGIDTAISKLKWRRSH